jgi:murein DD-endopeptidase MepM/ murein hydrolase activator NlpD
MGINFRNPGVLLVGAVLFVGGGNALTEMATGQPLLSGGNSVTAQQGDNAGNTAVPVTGWIQPASGSIGTRYGVPGTMWISGHHTGVDVTVPTGTPVKAAASGVVVAAGPGGQYGNQIVIRHQKHLFTQYAHLSRIDVRTGDTVQGGEQIALSGATGNATGPHLHFEVRTGPSYGSDINPMPFLTNR